MTSSMTRMCIAITLFVVSKNVVLAGIIFESATLEQVGVPREDVGLQIVPGYNVKSNIFAGARFELTEPISTTSIGGLFVGPFGIPDTFFGAIVQLSDANDFPDSEDLSTPDVLGMTLLTFPNPSAEIVGLLELQLEPGWYALVFGSGLFGSDGAGAVLVNNTEIGTPDYIGFQFGAGWGPRDRDFDNSARYVVNGQVVPEPAVMQMSIVSLMILCSQKRLALFSNLLSKDAVHQSCIQLLRRR